MSSPTSKSGIMETSKTTTTTQVPGSLGFVFDVIIVRISLPKINNIETSKLSVNVKFIKNDIKITSSRINVDEFKSGRSYEFSENPKILKDQLYKNPLTCKVLYDGKTIGRCEFLWPDTFLNCITECAGELTRCEEADIKHDNAVVGNLEMIMRLQVKCHEFDEKLANKPKTNTYDLNDKVIDPNDILFMVGEEQINNTACECDNVGIIPATDSEQSIYATTLDLSNFRRVNGTTVANTDIFNTIDDECCNCKKSSNKYQHMIDSLMANAKKTPCYSINQISQQQSQSSCEKRHKSVDRISGTRFASCSSSESTSNACRCMSDESNFHKNFNTENRKKRCLLCRENISWLPEYTACPKCGFKPINYGEDKPYNDSLTADGILKEFLTKNTRDVDSQQSDQNVEKSRGRCTCTKGKICAFCRIKILCADIFQPADKDKQSCGKCEVNPSDMYNVCKTSSTDCRPYLAKVFKELKYIYKIKVPIKKDNASIDAKQMTVENEQLTQKKKNPNHLNSRDKNAIERKNFLENNFNKEEACKGKIFGYRTERKYTGVQLGHKNCLNDFAGARNVPRNMGWLWSAEATGIRSGWKPGAIRKSIKVLMNHFLDNKTSDNSKKQQQKIGCFAKHKDGYEKADEEYEEDCTQQPVLHICKRNGAYYVTLRPIKDSETLKNCADHNSDMKPIQFKITKNPILLELRDLKRCLKAMGFPKCTCHQPISLCCCRSFLEKKKLEYQCHKECRRRNLYACADSLVLTDTSDSEAEFDFGVTPPAGVPHPNKCLRKRRKVSTATQYEDNDWNTTAEYPQKLTKYDKLYNCAVGERFGKAFGPYGIDGYKAGAVPVDGIYGPCGFIGGARSGGGGRSRGRVGRGKGMAIAGPGAFLGPDGKFSMEKYLEFKSFNKPSPAELAEKRKQRMALLKGVNPPLLCMVDRRGKPFDYSASCAPMPCDPACLRDNRIC